MELRDSQLLLTLHCLVAERVIEQEWHAVVTNPHKYTVQTDFDSQSPKQQMIFPRIKHHIPIINYFAPQETWLLGAIATKFDALSFSKFYASLVAGVVLEEWSGLEIFDSIYTRYCYHKPLNRSSFSLSKQTVPKEFKDEFRVAKIRSLRESSRTLFKSIRALQDVKLEKRQIIETYWHCTFKECPKFAQLPREDRDAFDALFQVMAHIICSIFENPVALERAKSLVRKIPITFITTSLYFINPAPFISQALRLYMWSPTQGVASLCQRLAGALCGYIPTRNNYIKLVTEYKNETWFEPLIKTLENNLLSSFDSDSIFELLLQNNKIEVTPHILVFCRLYYRYHEKKAFVEHFTGIGDTSFLTFIGQTLPILMNELSKATSLSTLVTNFFKMITNILDCISLGEIAGQELINFITAQFLEFMEYFYPILHFSESKRGEIDGMHVFTSIVDVLFGKILRLDDFDFFHSRVNDVDYHVQATHLMKRLDREELESLVSIFENYDCERPTLSRQLLDEMGDLFLKSIVGNNAN